MSESPSKDPATRECAELLREASTLVASLEGGLFRAPGDGPVGGIGAQIRHVVEFFQAFLDGVPAARIDYDARPRDRRFETDPTLAGQTLATLGEGMDALGHVAGPVEIRMDDPSDPAYAPDAPWLPSSIERELRFLASHTTHHFAIIRVLLAASDVRAASGFGIAPATRRYREGLLLEDSE